MWRCGGGGRRGSKRDGLVSGFNYVKRECGGGRNGRKVSEEGRGDVDGGMGGDKEEGQRDGGFWMW